MRGRGRAGVRVWGLERGAALSGEGRRRVDEAASEFVRFMLRFMQGG